jgi:hypothetical protein
MKFYHVGDTPEGVPIFQDYTTTVAMVRERNGYAECAERVAEYERKGDTVARTGRVLIVRAVEHYTTEDEP